MRSNGLLKWLMLPMALLLVFIGIKLFSGDRGASPLPGDAGGQLTADEMRALGIEGDTPHDTVATLVAQVRQLRTELQTALSDNRNQRAENDRLRQRERSIEQRIQNVLDTERAQLRQDREQTASERQQAQGLLQDLQRQFEGLGGRAGHTDLPIGLGLEDGDGQHFGRDGVRWIEPDDARPAEGRSGNRGGFSFPNDFSPVGETLDAASETLGRATGGVRCHRFLRDEDILLLGWAGPRPAIAAAASGSPIDLPSATGKRDGSGTPSRQPIAAVASRLLR